MANPLRRLVAAALGDVVILHFEVDGRLHAAKQQIGIHHFEHVGELFDHARAEFFPAADGQVDFFLGRLVVRDHLFDTDLLEVEHNIHYVLHDAPDGGKFVVDAANAHRADGIAFKRGESRTRRRELPTVWPKPGSNGLNSKDLKISCFLQQDFVGLLEIKYTHIYVWNTPNVE